MAILARNIYFECSLSGQGEHSLILPDFGYTAGSLPQGTPTGTPEEAVVRKEGQASGGSLPLQPDTTSFLGSIGLNVSNHFMTPFMDQQHVAAELRDTHPCGRRGGWMVIPELKRQFPARCKLLGCDYCLPREAALRQLILAESMPDSEWSQTMVAPADAPDPWSVVHYKMNLFFGYYRNKKKMRELSYTVEMNPQSTGYHIHALCHGPHWDMELLRWCQKKAGLGAQGNHVADIHDIHDATNYGMKGFRVAGYSMKGYTAVGDRRESLRINGMRLEHHTRRFIRVNGRPVTMAIARKAAIVKKYGDPKYVGVWRGVPLAEWQWEYLESYI